MSEPAHSLSDLPAGTMVGAYRIDRRLGAGGMGTVYAGVEPTIGKKVAIKVLKHAFAEDSAAVERFKREAQAANDVGHPGIVDVFAIGSLQDGRPYLVMSLLEGRTLRDELGARTKFGGVEAWTIARDVAEALSAAHARGIVHRDLKPDNVFLERVPNRPPRVRLLDFGLAKMTEGKGSDLQKLTGTGMLMGTPAYMAPEQWWASGIDAATDQYALGAMLFEMLTGGPPFRGAVYAALLQQHLHEKPPTLAACGSDAGAPVEALVARMLAKAGKDRFPTIDDAIRAGDAAFGVAPASASTPAPAAIAQTEISRAETLVSAQKPAPTPVDPAAGGRALRRFFGVFALVVAAASAGVVVVGYTGERRHSPVFWSHIAGWGSLTTLGVAIVAAMAIALTARTRSRGEGRTRIAWGLTVFTVFSGGMGTYTGWAKIIEAIRQLPPTRRFAIFGMGMYEANASRFIGFTLGAILSLGLVALAGVSAHPPSRAARHGGGRKESLAAIGGLVLLAAFAAVVGAPSASLVAAFGAAALAVGLAMPASDPERAASDEVERGIAALVAVALASGAGFARIEAREGYLWLEAASRAARAREIVAAAAEGRATHVLAFAAFGVLVAVEVLRVRRLRRDGFGIRVPWVWLGLLFLAGAVDWVAVWRVSAHRETFREATATQFSLVGRLEPPLGASLDEEDFAPKAAPSLQVSEGAIVVDGQAVAKLAAAPARRDPKVSRAIARVLERAVEGEAVEGAPDLAVTVDRSVRWRELAPILRLARDEGARRVDFLLARSRAPALPPDAPTEASFLVPEDFVALPATLDETGAVRPAPDATWGSIVGGLVADAASGPAPISIAR